MAGGNCDFAQWFSVAQIHGPGVRAGQGPQKRVVYFGFTIRDNNISLYKGSLKGQ
jgi:hypothetical protein